MSAYRVLDRPAAPSVADRCRWDRRGAWALGWLAAAGWAGAFPVVSALATHRTWGLCAAVGYVLAAAAVMWLPGRRARAASVVLALAGAVVVPLLLLVLSGAQQSEVGVIERSMTQLLATGSPYLPDPQGLADYNPYLPGMALLGLPRAVLGEGTWATAWLGDARMWCGAVFLGCLAAGRAVLRTAGRGPYGFPGRGAYGRPFGAYGTPAGLSYGSSSRVPSYGLGVAALIASPVVALPLCVSGVDLPLTGVCCLALAFAARGRVLGAGVSLALACSFKWTAWPALPVALAVLVCLYGWRAAARCLALAGAGAAVLIVPSALLTPAAMVEHVLAFPTGRGAVPTPASSPLPGHLLAGLGTGGWLAAVVLLGAAALAVAVSLVVRRPAGVVAGADRLALGLTAAFLLAPAGRFGYLALPVVLVVWSRLASESWGRIRPGRGVVPPDAQGVEGYRSIGGKVASATHVGGAGACAAALAGARRTPEAVSAPAHSFAGPPFSAPSHGRRSSRRVRPAAVVGSVPQAPVRAAQPPRPKGN
ncbi:glycosyltransferase 87 family protein [Streptomyces halobius]|uniref:Glycosyltransferase 87 family protein n=1 Tax=Streptomyces halobius TaxID=2879846 RepID=A0ABY4M8B1_9ACTN|nr:glycosyltransferase 87 family protein [Streptomyces halobius]UQA94011.1 glycosyltransferase 87 family protein [Streptomyces halobius]